MQQQPEAIVKALIGRHPEIATGVLVAKVAKEAKVAMVLIFPSSDAQPSPRSNNISKRKTSSR